VTVLRAIAYETAIREVFAERSGMRWIRVVIATTNTAFWMTIERKEPLIGVRGDHSTPHTHARLAQIDEGRRLGAASGKTNKRIASAPVAITPMTAK
jgi:hypothetical protein